MLDVKIPVAQLVLDHAECAPVLQRHRIDYCCHGKVPLEDACRARGLEPAEITRELERAIAERRCAPAGDARQLTTPELITQIVRRHHRYERDALKFLQPLATKVARVHGGHDARLLQVRDLTGELAELLLPHLDHEETVLFPALLAPERRDAQIAVEQEEMSTDHADFGALLARLRTAAGDYAVPEWACTSYSTLMKELVVLEADVFQHLHLENHVLLPRFQGAAARGA